MVQMNGASPDPVVESTIALLKHLFPPPRNFAVRLWNQDELPAAGEPAFTLVLNHPGALRRMFSPPIDLSLGEAFIYGDFDVEGNFYAFFGLLDGLSGRNFSPADATTLLEEVRHLPKSMRAGCQSAPPSVSATCRNTVCSEY